MHIFDRLADHLRRGTPVVLATVVRTRGSVPRRAGARMVVRGDGHTEGTVGGGEMEARVVEVARALLEEGGANQCLTYRFSDPARGDVGVCGGEMEVYVEVVRADPKVVVVGGGHVGRAVVHLARWLGLQVVLTDDRADFCTEDAVPGAHSYVHAPLAELPARIAVDARTCVVLTTRSVEVDVSGLPAVLASEAGYVGVIGSERRWATARAKLAKAGVPEEDLAKVRSPVGIEIGAETPEEIAVSILADVVAFVRT